MTGPRDWDKEMAEIDKLMASDRAPASPPAGEVLPRTGYAAESRTWTCPS